MFDWTKIDTIDIKFNQTGLNCYFDQIICSHEFGAPKEDVKLWYSCHERHGFDPKRALFIDDNLDVLRAARDFGIDNLLAVHQPDSSRPDRDVGEFGAIRSFAEIMPRP